MERSVRRNVWSRFKLPFFFLATLTITAQSTAPNEGAEPMEPKNRFGLLRPLPRKPGAIRVATYNLLNLFDHKDDPSIGGKVDDFLMAIKDRRGRALAKVIRAIDADILALQEIESLEALLWFRDTYLSDAGYRYVVSLDVGHYRGIEQSVMSRFPITGAQVWPGVSLDKVTRVGSGWTPVPLKFQVGLKIRRSPLRVDVKINEGFKLSIFNVHHKAARNFPFQREAEALKIVEFINELERKEPKRNIIVAGDFNANPWDKSLRVYLDAGLIDTLSHRVVLREGGVRDDKAANFITHESGTVRDYMFLNKIAHGALVTGSAHVYGTLYIGDYEEQDRKGGWKRRLYPEGYASDHYPVIIDLIPGDVP